jgi:hypothetical protein
MTTPEPTLGALISTHDATQREFSTALARGDSKGAEVAAAQLSALGKKIDIAAQDNISDIDVRIGQLESMTPEMQNQMRELSIQAATLGRLASEQFPSGQMSEELRQSRDRAHREVAKSMAMIILFITLIVAFITGYYSVVIAIGMTTLFLVYKPFSTSFRWHNIYRKLRDL